MREQEAQWILPQDLIGKHVTVVEAIPIPRGNGEVGMPEAKGKLVADGDIEAYAAYGKGMIVVEDASNNHQYIPKARIWKVKAAPAPVSKLLG